MRMALIVLTLPALGSCAFMEDVGEATLDVAAFTIEGAGRLAEVTITTAVDVTGTTIDAIAEETADTTRTVARETAATTRTVTREAIDTSADTTIHAAHHGVRLLEDTDTRQILELARPDGARFLKIITRGIDTASGRHVTDVRYEGRDRTGRHLPIPAEVRAAFDERR
ncbi:MAG: hypothetical protein CMJ83_04040 [Planctomycetes bacterium]|nr:hypothetical protein [Planctomycetota bacterium]